MSSIADIRARMKSKYGDSEEEKKKEQKQQSKQEQTRQNKPASEAAVSNAENVRSKMNSKYKTTYSHVDGDYINSFFKDAQSYLNSAGSKYSGMGYSNSRSTYEEQKKKFEDLRSRSGDIRQYLKQNKSSMKEEDYTSYMSLLDKFDQASISNDYSFYKKNEHYSQWDSQDAYNEHLRQQKINNMSSEEIKAEQEAAQGGAASEKENASKSRQPASFYLTGGHSYSGSPYVASQNQTEIKRDTAGIAYTTADGRNVTWQELYDSKFAEEDLAKRIGEYSKNDDWKAASSAISTVEDTETDYQIAEQLSRTNVAYDKDTALKNGTTLEDWEAVNKKRQYISDKYGVDFSNIYDVDNQLVSLMEQLDSNSEKEVFKYFNELTDDEKKVLSYIDTTQGREAAIAWYKDRENLLKKRYAGQVDYGANLFGQEMPVFGSAASVATSLGSAVEAIFDLATGDTENTLARATSGIRGGVSSTQDWMIGDFDAFDFLYNTGMSLVDSQVAGNLLPFKLGSGKLGQTITGGGLALGLSATAQGINDAKDRGMSDDGAILNGIINGVNEMLFESWSFTKTGSLGAFLEGIPEKTYKDIFKNLASNILTNAEEEFLTELSNVAYDTFANSDFSQLETSKRTLMANGMDESEATKKAWGQIGRQLAEAAASGALMGFGTGSVGRIASAYDIMRSNAQYNQYLQEVYGAEPGALISEALEIDPDNVFAQKMQSRLDSGKDLSGKQLNKLVQQNEAAKTAQNMANMQATAETRLTELGETGDVAVIAAALTKQAAGEKLTKAEQRVISTSEHSQQVAMELNQQNNTNGVVSPIRTDTIGAERFNRNAEESTLAVLAQQTVADRYADDQTASAEGHAILNDEAVDIADVADAGNGNVTVKLTDGRTVEATALDFEDSGEAGLWRVVGKYAADAESARALLEEYRGGDLDAYKYARGVEEAFLYGKLNISPREMAQQGSYVNLLNPTQKNMAYKQGIIAGQKQMQAQQVKLDNNKKKNGVRKGELHFEGDRGKLTKRQKVSLQACEVVAKALGVQVYVFESDKVGGTRVGENGWYDPKDGSIHIDLYAGQNGEGVMVFTLAHELTHFIRDWSPAKFQTLSKFLAEQYAKKGQSVADLVRLQQKKAAEDGQTLSFEEAHEEWVADSMETMLSDGSVIEKLAMLQAKDKSLVEKIKEFLKDFVKRLKEAYQLINPQTTEGRIVADMVDAAQELQDLFADALLDAGENFQKVEKNTTGEGGVKMQLRNVNGTNVVWIENSGFTNSQLRDPNVIAGYIASHIGDVYRIIESGQSVYIGPELPGEYTHSKYTSHLQKNSQSILKAKNKATPGIGEMIEIATNRRWEKTKHGHNKDAKFGMYRYDTQFAFSVKDRKGKTTAVKAYSAELLIRNASDGKKYLYDIVNINEDTAKALDLQNREVRKGSYEATTRSSVSANSIRNSEGNVKENDSEGKRKSSRSGGVSDRAMLVDLFEQTVTDSNEYKALQNYKKNIDRMMALEEHLERLSEEIKRLSFAEGPRDMELLNNLKLQQKKAVQELNRYDNQLLQLEKSGVLRAMVERNRKLITQQSFDKAREYYRQNNEKRESEIRQYYRESRRQAVERHDKAQVRQRIRKDVQRLDSLLNKGTKEKNVKLELQDFAGAALRTAKGVFLKNYNEYEMVRSGVDVTLSREHKAVFARCQELLKELDQIRDEKNAEPAADSLHQKWDPEAELRRDDREEALKKELAKNMAVLRDAGVFRLENERIEDAVSDQLMDELMEAYSALQDSESAHVRGVFNRAIYDQMENVKKFLAGKAIKDMTTIELGELQKMYRMVLHTITTSNELFAQKRKADVRKLGEEVIAQLQTAGKDMTPEILDRLQKMGWANLKPETALELIGSDTLTEMMQGLYRGEDTYALDIEHARQYAERQGKTYGRKNWDMNKSVTFAGTKITLGQAMSLYAYTKREQAQGHLEGEGFTYSSSIRIKEALAKLPIKLPHVMNATRTYVVSRNAFSDVEKLLTPEQRKYVDAMQEYLSRVMGAKGNEVSLQMYGIKLFEEETYFPLKTAAEFREESLGATTGEVKLKNSGFTKKPEKGAKNPIVLDSFEDVWAAHVNKMSLYHGFVLPMEDFDRVYNYRHAVEENVTDAEGEIYRTKLVDTNESVKVDIENKMGKVANEYIENFMKQLNGGVRKDSTESLFSGMVRNFKKTAVLGSLSVAVQQPTAFVRAMAYLNARDVGNPVDFLGKAGKPEGKILEEMYKYAPVALMKHIGGFDPAMGRTTKEYIFEDKKSIKGALDKFFGTFPGKMDEWTWSYIWVCTKRQIHRLNPGLKINSEEFLQKAGEKFSKIIRETQVYDSVLTKSEIMRSKNVWLQMATAFMNEPTTSMDMYIRSTIQAKRGKIKKNQAARTYAAVVCSQILTSAVAAFIYALRDDDEDETYWEKYISAAVGKAWENVAPWYSIPFIKDIFSIFEGYSVERSDMSLITDLYQGWNKLQSDNATPWEKTEAFVGSILNVFGIPLKNASRDVRGIFNTVNTWINGGVKGTDAGVKYAFREGLTGKKVPKSQQLQNAIAENDAAHIVRVLATYDTEEKAFSAFRSAAQEAFLQGKITDQQTEEFLQVYTGERVEDAQEKVTSWRCEKETGVAYSDIQDKFIAGEISAQKAKEMCMTYGGYSAEEAQAKVTSWRCEKETGIAYSDIQDKFVAGEISVQKAKEMCMTYGGYSTEEAQEKVTSWRCEKETGIAYGDIKETFMDGKLTSQKVKNMYITYGGLTEEKANEKVAVLEFVKKYPDLDDITYSAVENYTTYCERAGVPAETYYDAWKHKNTLSGEVKEPMMQYINGLNLTYAQKDGLYYAFGWKQSKPLRGSVALSRLNAGDPRG